MSPVEGLRNLALALERLAAREAASSMVRGAADGLRQELPEVDAQLRTLLSDVLTVLGRLVHEAAEHQHLEPAAATHALAVAATQGALEVLEREWQDGGMPLHGFVLRINQLLDEVMEFAHSRTDEIRSPMERGQALARGMVKAAVEELRESMPALEADARKLAPRGAEVARKVGGGFIEGAVSGLEKDADALGRIMERLGRGLMAGLRDELASSPPASREALTASVESLVERSSAAAVRGAARSLAAHVRPLLTAVGTGGALLALSLLAVRWRTA
ncbi:hypothetical protein [Pyxidicoccus xibeiensis]|uniref:hypothetical protein n=1 Tax=Pyxidicoccus xibeiensis TaxID=2906759 RepID=UPI0020A73768|nr:hypothetical protein [Pyxidicoccus xibeiensis]MCP3137534.1 hypothetical protein [Pyxidicoccus xibeiensis]